MYSSLRGLVHAASTRRLVASRHRWTSVTTRRYYQELSYASHGEDPASVLEYDKEDASDEDPPSFLEDAVRVEMWHAPLNPADINSIQGKYPSLGGDDIAKIAKSRFASGMTVAGSEGWGHITNAIGDTGPVQVGDIVTMGHAGLGTFRSSFWAPATTVLPLKQGHQLKDLWGSQFATIPQLGGTALRMLHDFVPLQPGEVVLQNAGNSGVGFMASQLGRELLDVSVVSIARRGERSSSQWDELVQHLMGEGKCAQVVAEEDLDNRDAIQAFKAELREHSATGRLPSLALNAVGGDSASILCKCLDDGGRMVTYGGMSLKPITIPTSQLIFRDLRLRGYWHSRWMSRHSLQTRQGLVEELAEAVLSRKVVCPPIQEFSLSQVKEALAFDRRHESAIRRKVVFRCQE